MAGPETGKIPSKIIVFSSNVRDLMYISFLGNIKNNLKISCVKLDMRYATTPDWKMLSRFAMFSSPSGNHDAAIVSNSDWQFRPVIFILRN